MIGPSVAARAIAARGVAARAVAERGRVVVARAGAERRDAEEKGTEAKPACHGWAAGIKARASPRARKPAAPSCPRGTLWHRLLVGETG